jgi:hypothetical protein
MGGSDKELSSKLSDTDKAYLAGLFDGEGCINATFGTKKWITKKEKEKIYLFPRIQFVISSKENLLLELVKKTVGFGEVYGKKMYDYRITERKQILNMLDALIPFVKLKKKGLQLSKEAVLFLLHRGHRCRWAKEELIFFHDSFVLPLQKLLPSGERRGRPPKYNFHEIISKYY